MLFLFILVSAFAVAQNFNLNTYGSGSTCTGLTAGDNSAFNGAIAAELSYQASNIATTTGTATAGGSTITVASGTGIAVNALLQGVGVLPNTFVTGGSGITWTLSRPVIANLSSTAVSFYPLITLTIQQNGSVVNISNISVSGTTVTVTTSLPHGWSTNQWVLFNSIVGIVGLNATDGGTARQITVISSTQFTVTATITGSYVSGGTTSSNLCTYTSGLWSPFSNGQFGFGFSGLVNVKVTTSDGTLATAVGFSDMGVSGNGIQFGAKGTQDHGPAGTYSCRTNTIAMGATSATCKTPTQAGIFTTGQYAMVGGTDLEGFGYPQNFAFWDYVLVNGTNTSTGLVSLSNPTTHTLEAIWPQYNVGDGNHQDNGGPASIFYLDPSWNWTGEFDGFIISQNAQSYADGLSATWKNVIFTGSNGPVPTQNLSWTAINVTCALCNMEVDKLIDSVVIDSSTWHLITAQSASVKQFTIQNGSSLGSIGGTFINFTCTGGSSLGAFNVGSEFYGASNSVSINNCSASSGPGTTAAIVLNNQISWTGNTITWPKSNGAAPWAVPGARMFQTGGTSAGVAGYPFDIVDVTDDATNVYALVTFSGPSPLQNSPGIRLFSNNSFTCVLCSGTQQMVDLNGAPAGAPLFTYSSVTYNPITNGIFTYIADSIWGIVQSVTINVTSAYTGAGSLTFQYAAEVLPYSTNVQTFYTPTVNLKQTGVRVITPAGVTGAQTGDSGLALPATQTYLHALANLSMSSAISGCPGTPQAGCPTVTITIQTSQGQFSTSVNDGITINGGITIK